MNTRYTSLSNHRSIRTRMVIHWLSVAFLAKLVILVAGQRSAGAETPGDRVLANIEPLVASGAQVVLSRDDNGICVAKIYVHLSTDNLPLLVKTLKGQKNPPELHLLIDMEELVQMPESAGRVFAPYIRTLAVGTGPIRPDSIEAWRQSGREVAHRLQSWLSGARQLETLAYWNVPNESVDFAVLKQLPRLKRLTLRVAPLTAQQWAPVCRIKSLEELMVTGGILGPNSALQDIPPNIKCVTFLWCPVDTQLLHAVRTCRELTLWACDLDVEAMPTLAQFSSLEALSLVCTRFARLQRGTVLGSERLLPQIETKGFDRQSHEELIRLCSCIQSLRAVQITPFEGHVDQLTTLSNLESLRLGYGDVLADNFRGFKKLRKLNLHACKIIGTLPYLPNLETLELSSCRVQSLPNILLRNPHITRLVLRGISPTSQEDLDALAALTNLLHLEITGVELSPSLAATIGRLRCLTSVRLSRTKLTSEDLSHITALPALTMLDLSESVLRGDKHEIVKKCAGIGCIDLSGWNIAITTLSDFYGNRLIFGEPLSNKLRKYLPSYQGAYGNTVGFGHMCDTGGL